MSRSIVLSRRTVVILRTVLPSLALAAAALASCTDEGPPAGPGALTATLRSPNGAEGAAVVSLFGAGIGDVTGSPGVVHWERHADTVLVVLLDDGAGRLAFSVEVADTTRAPRGLVLEVAGPDDRLRTSLAGYALELAR